MDKCQLNHYEIASESDLERVIRVIEKNWHRPLPESAKEFLRARFKSCIKKETSKLREEPFAPTFEEMLSGKSVEEIEKERREALESTWKRRRMQAFLYGSDQK